MAMDMIEIFYQWFEAHRSLLEQEGITMNIPNPTRGLTPNSIYADLRSQRYEWTAQVWENGLSDFHFLDWENMDRGVEATHYEFKTNEELFSALGSTLNRMRSIVAADPPKSKHEGY